MTAPVLSLADLGSPDPLLRPCGSPEGRQPDAGDTLFAASRAVSPLLGMPEAFRRWGVRFVLVDGWETRGRPGLFGPQGVQWHHTGSTSSAANPRPSLRTLVEGRSDLPGPLSQLGIGYDGTAYVIAAGRCNHAGRARAHGDLPAGDGNTLRVGIEVMTSGVQVMPAAQVASLERVTAALLELLGVPAARVSQRLARHYDTSESGKWDLGDGTGSYRPLDIRPHTVRVAAMLAAGPGVLMALSDDEQRELLDRVRSLPTRWYRPDPETPGRIVTAKAGDSGARRSSVLDTLDGNALYRQTGSMRAGMDGAVAILRAEAAERDAALHARLDDLTARLDQLTGAAGEEPA